MIDSIWKANLTITQIKVSTTSAFIWEFGFGLQAKGVEKSKKLANTKTMSIKMCYAVILLDEKEDMGAYLHGF